MDPWVRVTGVAGIVAIGVWAFARRRKSAESLFRMQSIPGITSAEQHVPRMIVLSILWVVLGVAVVLVIP